MKDELKIFELFHLLLLVSSRSSFEKVIKRISIAVLPGLVKVNLVARHSMEVDVTIFGWF